MVVSTPNKLILGLALAGAVAVTWLHWRRVATADRAQPQARPSAPPQVPASPEPVRSSPGRVACGTGTCDLASARCCYASGSDPACVARGEACPGGGIELACDETGDCPSPQVCCSRGGSRVCAPACGGPPEHQYCSEDSQCLEGRCVRGACRVPSGRARLKLPAPLRR